MVEPLSDGAYRSRIVAALYHERWEIESVLDEVKTHQCGRSLVLRSRHPGVSSRRSTVSCWSITHYAT